MPPLPSTKAARVQCSSRTKILRRAVAGDQRCGEAYMQKAIAGLGATRPGRRRAALNHATWPLGRWVAAGALEQTAVEDTLYTGRGAQRPGR